MKPVIRHGVFETNSSSTHSVCIAHGCIHPPNMEGKFLEVYPGEFGWEVQSHYDFDTKASYLYTWCYNRNHGYSDSDVEPALEGDRLDKLNLLTEVLKEYTKCYDVDYIKSDDGFYPRGVIDHQSDYEGRCPAQEAFSSRESLVQFLFNPNSFLHTDNDNH